MKWNRYIISALMMLAVTEALADSIYVSQPTESRYDKRIQHYRKYWASLIPTQFVIQNAGNMGIVSAGIGWDNIVLDLSLNKLKGKNGAYPTP